MANYCKNCNNEIGGNFCSHCGQSTNTHRISLHFLWHDVQHGLLHIEKGILFTTKELFTRPGYTIREFLQGKRVNHFKPISFVILLAGIYGVLSHYFNINLLANNIEVTGNGEKFVETKATVEKISSWMSQHYSLLALLQIPIFAIGTYIAFKKVGYNFIEHLVINSFIAGQKLIIHLIAFPLSCVFNNTASLKFVARTTDIISYAVAFVTIYLVFNQLNNVQRFLRTILSFVLPFIIALLIITAVVKLALH